MRILAFCGALETAAVCLIRPSFLKVSREERGLVLYASLTLLLAAVCYFAFLTHLGVYNQGLVLSLTCCDCGCFP
jgi:hypothetical protein